MNSGPVVTLLLHPPDYHPHAFPHLRAAEVREVSSEVRSQRLLIAAIMIRASRHPATVMLKRAQQRRVLSRVQALNNLGGSRGYEAPFSKISLTGFGPNINIARDPRFG